MNGRSVSLLAIGLVAGCMALGCGSDTKPAGGPAVDGAPPEIRKGVRVIFAQSASIGASGLYKEDDAFFTASVGEVEEVRGNWVRIKLRLSKDSREAYGELVRKGIIKEEESRWINFNTVTQFRVLDEK